MAVTTRGGREDAGAAAVEMAIVLPILLLLVFGIIDFGRALNAQLSVSAAAREGARWAALNQPDVQARVTAASPGLSPAPTATVSAACSTTSGAGDNATVTVSYPFSFVTPVGGLAGLFGGTGFGAPITLSSTGVMRCGG